VRNKSLKAIQHKYCHISLRFFFNGSDRRGLESGCLGIFDVLTNLNYRRQGYATALMQGILQWGIEREASFSYLQVVKANIPALKLYEKLGYQPMYEYWYRILLTSGK